MSLTTKQPFLFSLWKTSFLLLCILFPFSKELIVGSSRISLPSEPLIGISSLLLIPLVWERKSELLKLYKHPIFLTSTLMLIWYWLTSPFSSFPLITLKYLIVESAHFWLFFIGSLYYLITHEKQSVTGPFIHGYGIGFAFMLIYIWWQHSFYGFQSNTSNLAGRPFYFDHTMYSACMAMLLFAMGSEFNKKNWQNILLNLFTMGLIIGVFLSYSRATWLSVILVLPLGLLMWLKVSFFQFSGITVVIVLSVYLLSPHLLNHQQSKGNGLTAQAFSIFNTTTDVSNLERINRYKCAIRMFRQRPVTGFGSGTFNRTYFPFQKEHEMTRISVSKFAHHQAGRGGATHSEYLQALSEGGFPAFLGWIVLAIATLYSGFRIINKHRSIQALGVILAVMTYFLHAWLNNFLHTGKVAFLFWALLAAIIALDLTEKPGPTSKS